MKSILHALALALLILSQGALAEDEAILAQRSGCLACHKGVANGNGPAYKAVAEKYAGQAGADKLLAERIVKGTGPDGLGWMKEGKATLASMPPNGNVSAKDAAKLARWILGVNKEIDINAKLVSETLTISGLVENKLTLTVADLRRLPTGHVGELPVICQSGANRGKLENLKGVLLRDILEKAVVVSKSHNDVKKMAIISTATDDYKVVFSWSEIFNSPLGDGVMVFFEKDGLPLGDEEGRIAMVSVKDIRTGPRHVKWLKGIEVRKIAE